MAGKIGSLKFKNVVFDDNEDEEDAEYDCGLSLEKLSLGPKKKLLVLNLGGLLVHRVFCRNKSSIPRYRRPDATLGNHLVYRRPFWDEFMKFCFERFEVGIWSSARERNVDAALDFVMRGMRGKLLFVWDLEERTDTGFEALEKKGKPIFLKELKKLWDNKYSSLPWPKGRFSSSNTLLIDDKPYKALLNPPRTAIFPTEYNAENADDKALDADDVPSYVKEHPFGQPAITSLHSDWRYYSKIINVLGKD